SEHERRGRVNAFLDLSISSKNENYQTVLVFILATNPPMSSPAEDRSHPGCASRRPDEGSSTDRRSRTRGRLLEAMIEVGARLGHADSSVERVIGGRGIARSTFYEHFGDREECFLAALELLGGRLLEEVDRAVGGAPPGRAAEAAVEATVGFAEREPMAARFLFLESLAGGEPALALRGEALTSIAEIVEEAWTRVPKGAMAPDLPAVALIGGVFRLLAMRLRHGEADLEGLAADLDAWIGSYAVASGPPRRRAQGLGRGEPAAAEWLARPAASVGGSRRRRSRCPASRLPLHCRGGDIAFRRLRWHAAGDCGSSPPPPGAAMSMATRRPRSPTSPPRRRSPATPSTPSSGARPMPRRRQTNAASRGPWAPARGPSSPHRAGPSGSGREAWRCSASSPPTPPRPTWASSSSRRSARPSSSTPMTGSLPSPSSWRGAPTGARRRRCCRGHRRM